MLYGLRRSYGTADRELDGCALLRRLSSVIDGLPSVVNGVGAVVTAEAENGGLFSTCCTVLACSSVS